ncbi:MAG: 4-hydroxy-3-methylbut-2-enyl diphosphate reductase [Thermotogae bacterium]|nr:4-hydroxy-3-methylbut-2-enyl diphosphate reductase [Thermotogota bacterium]
MSFKVLLAKPRGFCAGVDRAVSIVERVLEVFGPPVYVRHAIVHNRYVVENLRSKGVIFVEDVKDIPPNSIVIFSAHGVSPAVIEEARHRNLKMIDATCPLVHKVHREVQKFAQKGYTIILVGHRGHVEVEGTMGEAPDRVILVETTEDALKVEVPDPEKVALTTQTTLSVDDTREIVEILRRRFPKIVLPKANDICYATQNRQDAVKKLARLSDVVLVIGSRESSNSNRLREVAEKQGVRAYLVEDETYIEDNMLDEAKVIGITSGASTPEVLVERVVARLREMGAESVEELEGVRESIRFALPRELTG